MNFNNYQNDQPTEETYLSPMNTEIMVEGFLQDVENIETMNGYAEYKFSFNPLTMRDDQMLMEHLEQGKKQLNELKPSWSNKVPRLKHIDKKKQIVCSQLFQPKLNIKVTHPSELEGRKATITLHLRDDPQGDIFLNASYVNVYPQGEPRKTMMKLINNGDVLEDIDF